MRQEFRATLTKAAVMASAGDEHEPSTSTTIEPCGLSPPRVLQTHQQHSADYVRLIMEEGRDLTMGED